MLFTKKMSKFLYINIKPNLQIIKLIKNNN